MSFDEFYGSSQSNTPNPQSKQQKKYFIILKLTNGGIVQKTYPTVDQAAQAMAYFRSRPDVDSVSRIGIL